MDEEKTNFLVIARLNDGEVISIHWIDHEYDNYWIEDWIADGRQLEILSAEEVRAFQGKIHETTAPIGRVLTNDEAMALVPRPMGKPEVERLEGVLVSIKEIFLH